MRFAPAGMPSPANRRHMVRRPELNLRYGLLRRLHDRVSGQTDGRRDITAARSGAELNATTSMFLARTAATLAERIENERLAHLALVADATTRRSTVIATISTTTADLEAARQRASSLPDDPPDLDRRGPAEARQAESVIHLRRRREYAAAVIDPALSLITELTAARDRAMAEKNELDALIDTTEHVTRRRIARLTEFYSRREATYRRAFLRASTTNIARARRYPPGSLDPGGSR